ncbi:hypothetical protein ACO0QE_000706 [Hanseniaspora vineae]
MSKARYYLEQCIPEVDDLVTQGIFTKQEVGSIMRKRTDFEHRLCSRGSSINDYVRYVNYEGNVDKLRMKRIKRLLDGEKKGHSISDYSIQRRIEYIFQRGCNKFPTDLKFWSIYLNYLKSKGNKVSYKKIHSVYNQLLRLHPTNVDIWISCAKFEYEIYANFKSCRTVFQNGLRFNSDSEKLWYEYIKFELNFITKLLSRRKVLKLINEREQEMDMQNQRIESKGHDGEVENESDDEQSGVTMPSTGDSMKDKLNELPDVDISMLGNDETNPALKGDIALAIYDIAMKTLLESFLKKHRGYALDATAQEDQELVASGKQHIIDLSLQYIQLFDKFTELNRSYLINHVVQYIYNNIQDENIEMCLIEMTLDVRYMTVENFQDSLLQYSVKKYLSFVAKCKNAQYKRDVSLAYKDYLRTTFLDELSVNDPKRDVLSSIIATL